MVEVVPKREKKEKKPKKIIRTAAGETWEDPSLEEWEKGNGPRLWTIVKMYPYICQGVVSMAYLNTYKLLNQCAERAVSMACLPVDTYMSLNQCARRAVSMACLLVESYILLNQCTRRVVSIICLDTCMLSVCQDSYLHSLFRHLYVKLSICKENF